VFRQLWYSNSNRSGPGRSCVNPPVPPLLLPFTLVVASVDVAARDLTEALGNIPMLYIPPCLSGSTESVLPSFPSALRSLVNSHSPYRWLFKVPSPLPPTLRVFCSFYNDHGILMLHEFFPTSPLLFFSLPRPPAVNKAILSLVS